MVREQISEAYKTKMQNNKSYATEHEIHKPPVTSSADQHPE